MKLSGGFDHSDAQDALQDTKYALQDLREVAAKGWRAAKGLLLESSSGKAVITAVEKLAGILQLERLSIEHKSKSRPPAASKTSPEQIAKPSPLSPDPANSIGKP